ncbi:MAG: DUF3431 domain-containing protein [Acidobacteriota bacterium]
MNADSRIAELTKEQCEIVVARYDEQTDWVTSYAHIATVYNKGKTSVTEVDALTLPNVGREAHTYLTHIVTNWDRLADRTVFFQGSKPEAGMTGHLMPNVSVGDYIFTERDPHLYITYCQAPRLSWLTFRNGYAQWNAHDVAPHLPKTPGMWPDDSPFDYWMRPFFVPPTTLLLRRDFERDCDAQDVLSQEAFWKKRISQKVPFPEYIFCAQGAQFSASRELLHSKPRSYYEGLLEELSYAANPYQGHHFEYFWMYLLQPDEAALAEVAQRKPQMRRGPFWKFRPTAWALLGARGIWSHSLTFAEKGTDAVLRVAHGSRRRAARARVSAEAPQRKILFVAHDATCVPPYAAARLKSALADNSIAVETDFAGLIDEERPTPQVAVEAAAPRGIDIGNLHVGGLGAEALSDADLVITTTHQEASELRKLFPDVRTGIEVLSHFDSQTAERSLFCPNTGAQWWRVNEETLARFDRAYDQVDRCIEQLAPLLAADGGH